MIYCRCNAHLVESDDDQTPDETCCVCRGKVLHAARPGGFAGCTARSLLCVGRAENTRSICRIDTPTRDAPSSPRTRRPARQEVAMSFLDPDDRHLFGSRQPDGYNLRRPFDGPRGDHRNSTGASPLSDADVDRIARRVAELLRDKP